MSQSFKIDFSDDMFLRRPDDDPLRIPRPNDNPLSIPKTPAQTPAFDINRARQERRRRQTELDQLNRRIMSQRQRDRREGTTTDLTPDLLRRDELGEDLRILGTSLRRDRPPVTPEQVLERRTDLQRQGLEQAQADLSQASARPSPEVIENIRRLEEQRQVQQALASRRPGGNVSADNLLPSSLRRSAAGELVRQQGDAMDDAMRRVAAFEDFGITPAQAATIADEANTAALRRNRESANARSEVASRLFAEDAEAERLEAQRQRVREAEEQRQVAAALAERRVLEQVGRPNASEAARLRLLEAQAAAAETEVEKAQIALEADRILLGQSRQRENLSTPEGQRLSAINAQREEFGDDADTAISKLVTAMELNTGGGFTTEEVTRNRLLLAEAMREIDQLPDPLKSQVAGDALVAISHTMGRSTEGTVPQFLANVLGETFSLDFDYLRRDDANDAMRLGPRGQVRRLAEMAGLDVEEILGQTGRVSASVPNPGAEPRSTAPTVYVGDLQIRRRPKWAYNLTDEEWQRTAIGKVNLR